MTQKKSNAPSKKKVVLSALFDACQKRGDFVFDNTLVKQISATHGFGNPFDVTKTDNLSVLPDEIVKQGYCVVHLGKGKHKFIKAVKHCFHDFEEINSETPWKYRKSALNETDTSESNILSIGFNQRIIHDFLYDDIVANPKMYNSRRTSGTFSYRIGGEKIETQKLQLEIDLTTEYHGVVTVFEGKNGFPGNFAVYQLFHPFRYFYDLNKSGEISIQEINCCYLLRERSRGENSVIRLYLYTFDDSNDMASIRLKKSEQYRLIER